MVKITIVTIASLIVLVGCGSQQAVNFEIPVKKVSINEINKDETSKPIIYKGGYDLEFRKPRVYWFRPLLTAEGNVLSERTMTVAPSKRKWTRKSKKIKSEEFNHFINSNKLKDLKDEM